MIENDNDQITVPEVIALAVMALAILVLMWRWDPGGSTAPEPKRIVTDTSVVQAPSTIVT